MAAMSRKRRAPFGGFKGGIRKKRPGLTWMNNRAARRRRVQQIQRKRGWRVTKFSQNIVEVKALDCAWNGVTLAAANSSCNGGEIQPSSGCTNALSVPAQGDGDSELDGRRYTIKSAWVSGMIATTPVGDAPDVEEVGGYFFALVLDTQTNGTAINSEDVFTNPSTAGPAILPLPLRNLDNTKRFKVLDWQYIPIGDMYASTDGTGTTSYNTQRASIVNLSWKGSLVCKSSATSANVTSAADNSLHLIGWAQNTALVPVFYGKSRVRFVG